LIQKSQIIPLLLTRCPTFQLVWEKHQKFWEGEEAGIYNDLAEFAGFIVDAHSHQEINTIRAAFEAIEELLCEGDEEVATAASIGFLEDVRNISSHRPFGPAVFFQWLGPNQESSGPKLKRLGRASPV
jgi:hypothetical protein